jgi:hypothetical protein
MASQESWILVDGFKVFPGVMWFTEPKAPNAMATTANIGGHNGTDGTVLLGRKLLGETFRIFGQNFGATIAYSAIMAHEFAHIAQFKTPGRHEYKYPELHADFMSGWYLGWRRKWTGMDLSSAAKQMYSIGDFQFNDPGHHGTPDERLAAFTQGVQTGDRGILLTSAFEIGRKISGF